MIDPVDMTETNEIFKEQALTLVDEPFLLEILEQVIGTGLAVARITANGTVCAELTQAGVPYARALLVSAREVFYTDEDVEEKQGKGWSLVQTLDRKLSGKQARWLDCDKSSLDTYIFIVKPKGFKLPAGQQVMPQHVELDMYYARKVVCSIEDLARVLAPAFSCVAHRASLAPRIECSRASLHEFDPPFEFAKTVTHPFKPQVHDELVAEVAVRGNAKAIKRLTEVLFQRILGSDYRLADGDCWPDVIRGDGDEGMPMFMLGNGERVALSFCIFLALCHDRVEENMCIGVKESLNALDMSRLLNTFDLVRDFVAATGVSICFQTDRNDSRTWAERKVKKGIELANSLSKKTTFF